MQNDFENIIPWNGQSDTGRDVRLKWEKNFTKIRGNFEEVVQKFGNADELFAMIAEELNKRLSKLNNDTAQGIITFIQGILIGPNPIDSMIAGSGTIIKNGRVQTDILQVRGQLEVLSLLINEIHAMSGDFSLSDCGTIEHVDDLGEGVYRLWMTKSTEFDFTTLEVNDVMYSIINTLHIGGNDYYTSWFRCLAKNAVENTLTVLLYPDSEVSTEKNFPPLAGYNVTRRGNSYTPTDGTHNPRQDSWLLSSREGRIQFLQNVFKPILEDYNYALTIGRFPNIQAIRNLPISENDPGIYAKIGVFERLYQVDHNGDVIPNEVMRGNWNATIAASDSPYRRIVNTIDTPNGSKINVMEIHTVYHLGCKWHCLIDKTLEEPGWNVPGWNFAEGNPEYNMELLSTNGTTFLYGNVHTVIIAKIYYGNIDITNKVMSLPATDVQWIRDTGNIPDDNAWKPVYDGAKDRLKLVKEDMGTEWLSRRQTMFTCSIAIPIDGDYKFLKTTIPFNV